MAEAVYREKGECSLCGRWDEGIRVSKWFVRIFICESCWSFLFRLFKKGK